METQVETGTPQRPSEADVEALARAVDGGLLRPGDAGYDEARLVWNGLIDRRPAYIVRCADAEDVAAAVLFARRYGLPLSVRGGAHGVAGLAMCDGGLVIDLSRMNAVTVDRDARSAHVGGGARWREVDEETQKQGLATPGGVVSDTGVAGFTLGGGYGWLRGMFGLACDNLVGAEIVTADGRRLEVNEREHSDLLWGLRGGGGNFGVVTRFDLRLHQLGPDVAFNFTFHDGARAPELLRFLRDYCRSCPDEVSPFAALMYVPDHEPFPRQIRGKYTVAFLAMYAGPVQEGLRVLEPLRAVAPPLADFSGPIPYVKAQRLLDEDYPSHTLRYYWKSQNVLELSDSLIDLLDRWAQSMPSKLTTVDLWHVGGAVARVPPEASAFHGRHVPFLVNVESNWQHAVDDAANIAWTRGFVDRLQAFSDGSRYLNFPGLHEEGEQAIASSYGPHYERLRQLKRTYDPTNLFRLNQNVPPAP